MSSTRTLKTPTSRGYRHLVTLQVKSSDDWNGQVVWKDIRTLFVDIMPRAARLQVDGQQEVEVIKYEIRTPWNPIGFPTEEMRLVDSARSFYIESVIDGGEMHREQIMVCTLERTDGET